MPLPPPSESSCALVTGASSGIGAEIARQLSRRGHNVALVARREERLRELADELGADGVRAELLAADMADAGARRTLPEWLDRLGLEVEVLVNNAGFGGSGEAHRADPERLTEMVRLNCEALLDLHVRFSAAMAGRGRGAILNVASTAAFQPIPGNATYAATKAFVLALSEGTHAELRPRGVTVTALCPGPVKTEFAEAAGIAEAEERAPDFVWTDVERVAREALEGAEKGRRVVVPGALNRAGALAGQHAPRGLALPVVKRVWRQAL